MINILVVVTGGIAAYKSADLISKLRKTEKYNIQVAMTPMATEFISPLTLETLSTNPVFVETEKNKFRGTSHISIATNTDIALIVPATADFIGKMANGIADNFALTTLLALPKKIPILIAPAMNVNMWNNSFVQKNLEKLKKHYTIIEPDSGFLACGDTGKGRLAPIPLIINEIEKALTTQKLKGLNIGITAGPTQEIIDPVRFISNHSSGKMGYALAEVAYKYGGQVTLFSGKTCLPQPWGINLLTFQTNEDLLNLLKQHIDGLDILIMSAAVSDYTPINKSQIKIKKNNSTWNLELKRTADILQSLSADKKHKFFVGFALESENIIENALRKKEKKNLDMIVFNSTNYDDSDIGKDYSRIGIITPNNEIIEFEKMTKLTAAEEIIKLIIKYYKK